MENECDDEVKEPEDIPMRIYLQWGEYWQDTTWCEHKVDEDSPDVAYDHHSVAEESNAKLALYEKSLIEASLQLGAAAKLSASMPKMVCGKIENQTASNNVTKFAADNKMAENPPQRPFARYPGTKNRIAEWIISYFPGHHDTFILPYGGMCATLFKKSRSGIEVINDLNDDIIHLFRMIRDHEDDLIHAIFYTPWAADSLLEALEPAEDPIERARRYFVRLWMSLQPYDKNPSFRRQYVFSRGRDGKNSMVAAARLFMNTDYLFDIADRLRGVVIENTDAVGLINAYDYSRALFYCDPPYVHATRKRTSHYLFEMNVDEHRKLAHTLNGISGMAIISGYACDLYAALYEDNGWERIDRMARTNGRDKMESIWLNPRVILELEEESKDEETQLSLL